MNFFEFLVPIVLMVFSKTVHMEITHSAKETKTPSLTFHPINMAKIVAGTDNELILTIHNYTSLCKGLLINATVDNNELINVEPQSMYIDLTNYTAMDLDQFNLTFTVRAIFLPGYSNITFQVEWFNYDGQEMCNQTSDNNWKDGKTSYMTSVVRDPTNIWMTVFATFMGIMVGINYINMGVQLDLQIVYKVLKRPVGPIIGFLCQFTCMPLAAFAYGLLFLEDDNYRIGLFAVGCSPGGSSSNFWTLLFGGDINLSITMTFISTIACLGMMPLWLYTLGRLVFKDGKVEIPFQNMAIALVSLTTPLLVGILVKRYLPKVAAFSRKIIRPLSLVIITIGMVSGSVMNYYIYMLFTWQMFVAGACVAFTGYFIGAFFAWLGRLNKPQIMAVSVETAIQNSSIPFVLLSTTLGHPQADLVIVPIMAQLLVTNVPIWLGFLIYRIIKRCIYGKPEEQDKKISVEQMKLDAVDNYKENTKF